MELNTPINHLRQDPNAFSLYEHLLENERQLGLINGQFWHNYPLYKDEEGGVITTKVLVISQNHGLIVFDISNCTDHAIETELENIDAQLSQICSHILSRLIRNNALRKNKTALLFPIEAVVYAPRLKEAYENATIDTRILKDNNDIFSIFNVFLLEKSIDDKIFEETLSTIEGAKGIIRPHKRNVSDLPANSKVHKVIELELAINRFDKQQRQGYVVPLDGPQRVRGIAGSGKTIVLAMKAALTHLKFPEAKIVYTFYTKSLYQHIKRLITRFYRQYDDQDPDWGQLKIEHAWGGYSMPGIYFDACQAHNVEPISFKEAKSLTNKDPFAFICSKLLKENKIKPIYDYIFIDEGQDFSPSFLMLCRSLSKKERFILAYDELQTIWQTKAPSYEDVFGKDDTGKVVGEFIEDVVLYRCYRNPREILVLAHALGFGLYSKRIVQMLENKQHWEDVGYKVIEGDFTEGTETIIERPIENSLAIVSENSSIEEIVEVKSFESFGDEVDYIIQSIKKDLDDGFRPDDILVISADDRYAKRYLDEIERRLARLDIYSNNLQSDTFNTRDFRLDNCITLCTVHKAKGNEAFMVYIVGVDRLFSMQDVRSRNMIFTAMTRAKGWVRLTGMGKYANICIEEVRKAKQDFPFLKFIYPGEEQLTIMKRDLAASAIKKQQIERKFDEIMAMCKDIMAPDEVNSLWEQHLGKYPKDKKGYRKK